MLRRTLGLRRGQKSIQCGRAAPACPRLSALPERLAARHPLPAACPFGGPASRGPLSSEVRLNARRLPVLLPERSRPPTGPAPSAASPGLSLPAVKLSPDGRQFSRMSGESGLRQLERLVFRGHGLSSAWPFEPMALARAPSCSATGDGIFPRSAGKIESEARGYAGTDLQVTAE